MPSSHKHTHTQSNSIYRNSKRFVAILLFNPCIKKMENYWILWNCHKCIFLLLIWVVDPITNLLVKLIIMWDKRVCIYDTSRIFYKYSEKIGPKAKMIFYLSFFFNHKIYSLRPTLFVLFEKSNFLREHHLLSCLPFKNV